MVTDIDLLVVEQHAIDCLDGSLGGLCGLVVNEPIALRTTLLVGSDLAGKNGSKSGESIMESLVVNGIIQVLDEDVALTSLAQGRVTLGPHDSAITKFRVQNVFLRHEARTRVGS